MRVKGLLIAARQLSQFIQEISLLPILPCGNFDSKSTAEWLTSEIFSRCFRLNPKLFLDDEVIDTICDLLTRCLSPEDYGPLLAALESAPNSEAVVSCFQKKEPPNAASPLADLRYRDSVLRPRLLEVPDENGKTELFHAVERGNFSEAKWLLSFGASPNTRDVHGVSVLEAALKPFIEGGHVPYAETSKVYTFIQSLVAYGADYKSPILGRYYNIFDCAFSLQNYGLLFALHTYYTPDMLVRPDVVKHFFTSFEAEDLKFLVRYYPDFAIASRSEAAKNIEQYYLHSPSLNPELFSDAALGDTLFDLLPLVSSSVDYGSLFVALQAAPNREALALVLQIKSFSSYF